MNRQEIIKHMEKRIAGWNREELAYKRFWLIIVLVVLYVFVGLVLFLAHGVYPISVFSFLDVLAIALILSATFLLLTLALVLWRDCRILKKWLKMQN